ncbi:hypothetical protein PRJ_1575 [Pseudomonas sp. XWY-1]|nr:hypothetical protein PRJ_1575 [Pseudomonas sp. XWY-1]
MDTCRGWAQAACRSGFTRKGPDLLANYHTPFTVAAATVFAVNPLLRRIGGGHSRWLAHRRV